MINTTQSGIERSRIKCDAPACNIMKRTRGTENGRNGVKIPCHRLKGCIYRKYFVPRTEKIIVSVQKASL